MDPTSAKRVLIKLSGEALMGQQGHGIEPAFLAGLARDLQACQGLGLQMALVVGGGNIFRGVAGVGQGMERTRADQMGMLATVINALAMESALEQAGVATRVMSGLAMPQVAETFNRNQAVRHLEAGRVVILAAGTGNPFFTTDTAAALRAAEIGADLLLKGTKVDGVYDADPAKNPQAVRFSRLTHAEVLSRQLGVMDLTAITLCRENHIPILVFSILEEGGLPGIFQGGGHCTLIEEA